MTCIQYFYITCLHLQILRINHIIFVFLQEFRSTHVDSALSARVEEEMDVSDSDEEPSEVINEKQNDLEKEPVIKKAKVDASDHNVSLFPIF